MKNFIHLSLIWILAGAGAISFVTGTWIVLAIATLAFGANLVIFFDLPKVLQPIEI